jgi:hypothetical protein
MGGKGRERTGERRGGEGRENRILIERLLLFMPYHEEQMWTFF